MNTKMLYLLLQSRSLSKTAFVKAAEVTNTRAANRAPTTPPINTRAANRAPTTPPINTRAANRAPTTPDLVALWEKRFSKSDPDWPARIAEARERAANRATTTPPINTRAADRHQPSDLVVRRQDRLYKFDPKLSALWTTPRNQAIKG